MKALMALGIALVTVSAFTQEVEKKPVAVPSNYNQITRIDNGETEDIACRITSVSKPHLIVVIDDPNYHAKKIYDSTIQDFVTKSDDGKQLVVENYPDTDTAAVEQTIHLTAKRTGTVVKSRNGQPVVLELWSWIDPQIERAAINRAVQQAENDARNMAALKKAEAENRAKQAKTLALKSNQDAAAKGDMFGLLRMGERYRDGDGVEKDLAKARDYLQKAADAGSPTAKDELSKLEAK